MNLESHFFIIKDFYITHTCRYVYEHTEMIICEQRVGIYGDTIYENVFYKEKNTEKDD